jgi:hypothetical protein
MATSRQANDGKMRRVAEGVYMRNGVYIVPIWNPQKGHTGGKDWHTLGSCACGTFHQGSTLPHAKALKRKLEDQKATSGGRRRRGGKALTVAEWAGHYDGDAWVPGLWLQRFPRKAPSTNIHNDQQSRKFARTFEGRTMDSITEDEAQVFSIETPGSFKVIHSMFNDAMKVQLVGRNPFGGLKGPRSSGRKDIVVLTDPELEQLVGIAKAVYGVYGPMFAAMIGAAAWTGVRPGELFLFALEPADKLNYVDLKAGIVHVDWQWNAKTRTITRPKYGSVREVALLPGAKQALESIDSWDSGQPVFRTKRGAWFTQRSHHYYWDPVRAAFVASLPAGHHLRQRTSETGGENLDFYELRHYFGTKLAHPPAGITPASQYEIAAMMGHKDNGKTALECYVHVQAQDARESISNAWQRVS